jgi:hypothetical protein
MASWTSAGIALLALVAVIVLGVLNLRQAKRGPAGVPMWRVEPAGGSQVALINVGTAVAGEVRIKIDATRADGEREFDVLAPGQRVTY